MKKPIKHVRHQAKRHHQEHARLKDLMNKVIQSEKLLGWFFGTLGITLVTLLIFFNWGRISSFFQDSETKEPTPVVVQAEDLLSDVNSFRLGMEVSQKMDVYAANAYLKKLNSILPRGYEQGITTAKIISQGKTVTSQGQLRAYMSSIVLSTELGNGQHLTAGRNDAANSFMKSIVTSYYIGEKTQRVQSALDNDLELLAKINNALNVDVFAYLNQSNNRADSLDNFLSLLQTLQSRAQVRSNELLSQINFLSSNFEAQENTIGLTEEAFFQSVENTIGLQTPEGFDNGTANDEFEKFLELEQQQTEIRAKVGAYQQLLDYYSYFLERLDILIRAINANRDPLIAGVKVVEIEDMQLPLIIREE